MLDIKICLFGGWWFTFLYWLACIVPMFFFPKENYKRLFSHNTAGLNKFHKTVTFPLSWILWVGITVYVVFKPLKTSTWYFWTGSSIFAITLIACICAEIAYLSTPLNKPVVRGLYRISRNPIYVFSYIAWYGAGVATASWVILFANTLYKLTEHYLILGEERYCLREYRDSYQAYMNKIPRYL